MKIVNFTLILISVFIFNSSAQQPEQHDNQEQIAAQKVALDAKLLKVRTSLFNWMQQNLELSASQESRLYDMIVNNEEGIMLFNKNTVGRYSNVEDALSEEERMQVNEHINKYQKELTSILNQQQLEFVMSRQTELQEMLKQEFTR